ILDALRLLFKDIYVKDYIGNTIESGLLSRPSPTVCRVSTWSGTADLEANEKMNATLLKIIHLLLKNYDVCCKVTDTLPTLYPLRVSLWQMSRGNISTVLTARF
ncbi:MAG: hypothetical protein J6M35_09270, partial [Clostridia bacterium]|nr:hypothetical protein [Clostridia bacterium]